MSSILKALKKLEDQTIEENAVLIWPDTTGTRNYRSVSKNRKKTALMLIIPCLMLAAAGGYAYYRNFSSGTPREKVAELPLYSAPTRPQEKITPPVILKEDLKIEVDNTPESALVASHIPVEASVPVLETDLPEVADVEEIQQPAVKPEKTVTMIQPPVAEPAPSLETIQQEETAEAIPMPAAQPETMQEPAVRPENAAMTAHHQPVNPVHQDTIISDTGGEVTADNADAAVQERHTDVRPEPEIRKKPPKPAIADTSSYKLVEDPRIDIQAIAWAPNSQNSFAVINNRIIREGGSVEGIRVLKIDKEKVVFQEGSDKWQQEFRVK